MIRTTVYINGIYSGEKLIDITHLRALTKLGQVHWNNNKPILRVWICQ